MISYELAKRLKDAGFPQGNMMYIDSDNSVCSIDYTSNESIFCPSLSELIEACGEEFLELVKAPIEIVGIVAWNAKKDENTITFGSTPEEAVANLWLELNKK